MYCVYKQLSVLTLLRFSVVHEDHQQDGDTSFQGPHEQDDFGQDLEAVQH